MEVRLSMSLSLGSCPYDRHLEKGKPEEARECTYPGAGTAALRDRGDQG